jgi:hypothetical protein
MFRGTPEEIAALKVGDVLYNFDGNRRFYENRHSAPVYSRHFEAHEIEGETKQSWIMRYGKKVNKKTLASSCQYGDRGYFTKSAMEADIWLHDHRHKIVRLVENIEVEKLKQIAAIVGYDETSPRT